MSAEQIAGLLLGGLLGWGGQIDLVNFVKNILGLQGIQAKLLAAAVAVASSAGLLLLTAGIGIADFTLDNFSVVFVAVYGLAEFIYTYRKDQ